MKSPSHSNSKTEALLPLLGKPVPSVESDRGIRCRK